MCAWRVAEKKKQRDGMGKKMAGGLLEYSGLVTKTKAMRARLLGADDYTAISEYESVTDFIAFCGSSLLMRRYLNGTGKWHTAVRWRR